MAAPWVLAQTEPTPAKAQAIAKEDYIYGLPLLDNYRIRYDDFVDQSNPEYKSPFNQIKNMPRVYMPEDKVIQTLNADTPHSMVGLDFRAEPGHQ